MRTLSALALGALLPGTASAFTFDDVRFWVGQGSNRAGFVVDFYDGQSPSSFAWGFRWEGAATGKSMIEAVDGADASFEADIVFSSFGHFVDAMRYLPNGTGWTHRGDPWPAGYFSYWTKAAAESSWDYAQAGMTDRALVDGAWDGWAWVRNAAGVDALPPTAPVAAVPEPATCAALGLGLAAMARRARRRS